MTRRVTANDVAEKAGVSRSAVSRTFTEGASVSARTRARVEQAAAELGYRPNMIARSLITRRSDIVGIAVGNMANPFYPALVMTLSRKLAAIGKRSLLFPVADTAESDPEVEEILYYQLDALLLASAVVSSDLAGRCRAMGVPVVLINRLTADSGCLSVTADNEAGGRRIGEFVAGRGYRRPAYLAGLENSSTSIEREAGFTAALDAAGLRLHARAAGNYRFDAAADAMRSLLAGRNAPDVVFCANDHMAFAAHSVATHEFGLTVGRDVGIIGFDDVAMAKWPTFSLTSYSQPVESMAESAIGLLTDAAQDDAPRRIHVPGELIVRASTG